MRNLALISLLLLKTEYASDADKLIFDFRSGHVAAFDHIFNEFYSPLCYFANRIIQDKQAAEDIAQDCFLKLWQKYVDFESVPAIKSFLYVSVRNACFNYLDKNKVRAKHDQYRQTIDLPEEQTVLHTIIEAELLLQVFNLVDTLPDQCRKVIRMTFEDGKKPKEIADELGIAISTVNNQKMRGLSLLRQRLSEKGLSLATVVFLPELLRWLK